MPIIEGLDGRSVKREELDFASAAASNHAVSSGDGYYVVYRLKARQVRRC